MNKILAKLLLLSFFTGMLLPVPSASAAEQSAADFDAYDKELNDLDAKIQDHLKRAREAAFWSSEHTAAPAGTAKAAAPVVGPTTAAAGTNIKPKNSTASSIAQPVSRTEPAPVMVRAASPAPQSRPMPAPVVNAPVSRVTAAPSNLPTQRDDDSAMPAPNAKQILAENSANSAPAPNTKQVLNQNYDQMDQVDREIESRTHVSGTYRAGFGAGRNRNFSINDSNSDLQDRDFHYLFGDRQYNTFDSAIYSQYKVDIDSQVTDTDSVFIQMVADPWSYVGQTSEIMVPSVGNEDSIRIKQRYWGPNNSTVPYIVRSNNGNSIALPELEAKGGATQAFTTHGFYDAFGIGSSFNSFNVPAQDIDYEFRPLRKAWWDHEGDIWHVRLFALADQNQVMTTDDPMQLSNRKDFWQHSAWLEDWQPIQKFNPIGDPAVSTVSPVISRGRYSEDEAFAAKDSAGNYLTLLRGAAVEADFGRTYLGMMIASRYGLWDSYADIDNIPGVVRMKHQVTEPWMVGATYTYRVGLVDREPDAYNQVIAMDTKYYTNETDYVYGEIAGSRNDIDRLSSFQTAYEGMAYQAGFVANTNDSGAGNTRWNGDFAWFDTEFKETQSKYVSLKDDEFWGNHISWAKIPVDVEPFKIGTGLDYGRYVARLNAISAFPDRGVENLFDVRHVRDTDSNSFIENVIRDETTWKFAPDWTFKNFMRFHILPATLSDREPFISSFNPPYADDPALKGQIFYQNLDIDPGLDANRRSFGQGLQWEPTHQWTVDGTFEMSNDIPDFPRGLLNNTFGTTMIRDPNTPNIWLYRNQAFLYGQRHFDLPAYDYYSIVKERVIYRYSDALQFIFHAAQNTYTLWGPVDDNVEHQGISIDWQISDRWSAFFDYSHSHLADVPKFVNNGFNRLDFDDHHNIYTRLKYRVNASSVLTMEYGVFGQTFYEGSDALPASAYSVTTFSLPTVDTEHLFRMSLDGEF